MLGKFQERKTYFLTKGAGRGGEDGKKHKPEKGHPVRSVWAAAVDSRSAAANTSLVRMSAGSGSLADRGETWQVVAEHNQ